jgi:ABC-2 type transport system permease protein
MSGFFTLVRRLIGEARWTLVISMAALFLFGWLNTFVTAREIARFRERIASGGGGNQLQMARGLLGGDAEVSAARFEMLFWMHPFLWLPTIIWAVGRGSLSVAGELERGTLDLVISRPVSRGSYLTSQIGVACLGLVLLSGAVVAGNRVSTFFNKLEGAPTVRVLFWPALNLAMLGLAVFGITLAASAADRVRWRATLFGTVATIASFASWVVARVPAMEGTSLKPWLQRLGTLFEAYNPVDAVGEMKHLAFNLEVLGGLGLGGIVVAYLAFLWRDLPASG